MNLCVKKRIIVLLFGAFIVYYAGAYIKNKANQNLNGLSAEIVQLERGYGYEIYANKILLIKQYSIPGVQGERSFQTFEDAQVVAQKIKAKLLYGDSPVITKEELQVLNVKY